MTSGDDQFQAHLRHGQRDGEVHSEELAARNEFILNTIDDLLAFHDSEHRILWCNRAAAESVGRDIETLRNEKCYRIWHGRESLCEGCPAEETLRTGKSDEKEVSTPDGRIFNLRTFPIKNASGEILGVLEFGRDITAQKKARAELEQSEKRFRAVFNNATTGVVLCNETGQFLECNAVYETITGYRIEQLREMDYRQITFAEDLPKEEALLKECIQGQKDCYTIEKRYVRPKGNIIWVRLHVSTVRIDEEHLFGVGLVEDITKQKEMLSRLSLSEERFDAIFNNESVGFVIGGAGGEILRCNRAFAEMVGYSQVELESLEDYIALTHPEDVEKEFPLFKACSLGESNGYSIEKRYIHKDGSTVWANLHVSAIQSDTDTTTYIAVVEDLTERNRVRAQREKAINELEDKNKELEGIIHIASHDLRTPLVNIKGFSREMQKWAERLYSILNEKYGLLNQDTELAYLFGTELKENMSFIFAGVERIDSLLNALLRLARLGKAGMIYESLDMESIFEEICHSMAFVFQEHGIEIKVNRLPGCRGDRAQLGQVFVNLLSNAVKYCNPDVKRRITISGETQDEMAVYCIEDNGIGIHAEHLEKIFDIFYRVSGGKGTKEGDGIGLTIVRRIVDRHDGKVWAESEPGKGSRFYVALPCRDE